MTMLESIVAGLIILFIGWLTTPFGKPLRHAMDEWWNGPVTVAEKRLGLVHGKGKPYLQDNYSTVKAASLFTISGTLYTYRVGIINKGDSTLHDVEVKLTNIKECPREFNATGGHLHWEHDNPPDGQPFLTKKSIPPTRLRDYSDAVFVDVLRCFWPDKKEERQYTQLQVCHVVPGVSVVIPLRKYELVVTAHDQRQATVAGTLHFEPQGEEPPKLTLLQ